MNESQFLTGMEKLVSAFNSKVDAKRVDIYLEMLKRIPDTEWYNTVDEAIKYFAKFPSVAELYNLWKQLYPPQGVSASTILDSDASIRFEREENLRAFEEMKSMDKEKFSRLWAIAEQEVDCLGLPDWMPTSLLTKFRAKNLFLKENNVIRKNSA